MDIRNLENITYPLGSRVKNTNNIVLGLSPSGVLPNEVNECSEMLTPVSFIQRKLGGPLSRGDSVIYRRIPQEILSNARDISGVSRMRVLVRP